MPLVALQTWWIIESSSSRRDQKPLMLHKNYFHLLKAVNKGKTMCIYNRKYTTAKRKSSSLTFPDDCSPHTMMLSVNQISWRRSPVHQEQIPSNRLLKNVKRFDKEGQYSGQQSTGLLTSLCFFDAEASWREVEREPGNEVGVCSSHAKGSRSRKSRTKSRDSGGVPQGTENFTYSTASNRA